MEEATREIFGNISEIQRLGFYIIMQLTFALLLWRVGLRIRLWRQGVKGDLVLDWRVWIRRLFKQVVMQEKVRRKPISGFIHIMIFSGFIALTIGTILCYFGYLRTFDFHYGWYYLIYEFTMDFFAVLFCLGCSLALVNRYRKASRNPAERYQDMAFVGLLLLIGVTGCLLEGLRIHYSGQDEIYASWSFVGYLLANSIFSDLSQAAQYWHMLSWWFHVLLFVGFMVSLPVNKLMHLVAVPLTIALQPERKPGVLAPLDTVEVEESGRIGVAGVSQFKRRQLLSLDACVSCERCLEVCPTQLSSKTLSPQDFIGQLRSAMTRGYSHPDLQFGGHLLDASTILSCTQCQFCADVCPMTINHTEMLVDLRRNLVAEGKLSGTAANALRSIASRGNPYGLPKKDRMKWAEGLDVPTVVDNPDFEYLLWVGCAGAYDPGAQKIMRDLVLLLKRANIKFAVLGKKEMCTGDSARRLGDEFLFQEMAIKNVDLLNQYNVKKIITPCPHCQNTLLNEYPAFGGHCEVEHHSQVLSRLICNGQLTVSNKVKERITLHDPCYLARVLDETDSVRNILDHHSLEKGMVELLNNRRRTLCCGAGGGRMWFDENPSQRVSLKRSEEVIQTGSECLVTACPFCKNMMRDGLASTAKGDAVKVIDIVELLVNHREK
jgi:Fe-S oxidoreductase